MAIDTHSHIFNEAFNDDLNEVIDRIISSNIHKILLVGFSKDTNLQALDLASKYNFIYPTVGYHPSEANEINENDLVFLENLILNNKVYAIGECGLDYYWVKDNKDKQKELFIKQIELAKKYNKAVVVHSRDSIEDTYDIVKEYNEVKFIIHCFSSSLEMANKFIKLGCKLGIGGVLTFKNSKKLKEVVENIDISYLLLETDSPYLTPEPYRGKKNEPYNIIYVAEEIAKIKNISLEEVLKITTKNAISQFDLNI